MEIDALELHRGLAFKGGATLRANRRAISRGRRPVHFSIHQFAISGSINRAHRSDRQLLHRK